MEGPSQAPNFHTIRGLLVAKPELGTKRVCPTTGRKFYDLNKDPVVSPYTGEIVPVAALPTSRRAAAAPVAPLAPEVETPEPADVELVPLEEADAEAEGGKKEAIVEGEEDVEVADDGGAEDDTFLETDEDEGDDVSDIVGGEREDEEDT
jgi:uncharacterized protein (TIGR02300 family)